MPPRSEEEKARRKAEYLARKAEREKKKQLTEGEAAASETNASQQAESQKLSTKSPNDSGISLLLDLPEDALKQVLCCLPAAEIGKVSMTCSQMNQALAEIRVAFLITRLRKARKGSTTLVIDMCSDIEQARKFITQSLGGGDTGRIVQSRKKSKKATADEFVAFARFLEEVVHGYLPMGFREENKKSKALAPRFINGRFVSASPEHSLCRAGGDGHKCGAGGSGVGTCRRCK